MSGGLRLGEGGFAGGAALGDATYSEFGGEFVDPLGVEIFAVATAVPFDGFLMVAAPGFGDGVEKGLETGCSADILGRSASLAIDISRIFGGRLAGLHRLDGDDMFPIVSHIVGIEQLADAAVEQGLELDILCRKQGVVVPIGVGKTISLVVRFELPEVIIEPAHGALDDVVEHFEARIDRHVDPAPDERVGIGEHDVEAGDGLGHAAML